MNNSINRYVSLFRYLTLTIVFVGCSAMSSVAGVQFDTLYGSDLGMGIGARAIGMGGAFVSIADDPSAVFWNPAGLSAVNRPQVFISGETPADFSAASLIIPPVIPVFQAVDLTVGLSYIRRLRFKGDSGEATWGEYESHLLDLAMVDTGDDFSGSINSKTCDLRLSLA